MSTIPLQSPAEVTTQTPTVTFYQKAADDFMKAIDAVIPIIPKLEILHPQDADFVKSHLNVPLQFLDTAISVVEQTPDLQALRKMDAKASRDVLQFNQAFRPAWDKVIAVAQAIKDTMDTGLANVVVDSFQVYALVKAMSRDPRSAALVVHLKNLRRDLGRSGRSTKASAKPEQPPSAPETPPQQEDTAA
jgi:hypothetical protein